MTKQKTCSDLTRALVKSGELSASEKCALCKRFRDKLYARNLDDHNPRNIEWLCLSCLHSVKAREGWARRKRPKRTHEQQLAINRERVRLWRLRKRIERDLTGQSKRKRYKGMPLAHLARYLVDEARLQEDAELLRRTLQRAHEEDTKI